MLFNSFAFCFLFFPLVTAGYFLLPHRFRWALLLAASCWFYMAFVPVYILILAFTIVVDYAAGLLIAGSTGERRKAWLVASIVANLGVLAFFKYYAFLDASIAAVMQAAGLAYTPTDLGILLPIGLSFHTFQSLSYTIEVYRGHQRAERRPGIFALYVMFYPQLVAGPIERPGNLLNQLDQVHRWDHARVVHGLQQMLWGFFKKLVIADRCAVVVDHVYADPSAFGGAATLLATYLFALQIYCDFSGYTDIALGAARVMGFDLMVNFRTPYRSASISEFWSRWHISLSSWFRDYVYIPLGGNRVLRWRWYMNLLLVFLLSGLWHGASWTYVAWGGVHGLYLIGAIVLAGARERVVRSLGLDRRPRLNRALAVLVTVHLVVAGWVFFRATTFADAWSVLGSWVRPEAWWTGFADMVHELGAGIVLTTVALAIAFIGIDPWGDALAKGQRRIGRRPLRYAYFGTLLAACLVLGQYGAAMFIYFQF
ncbi:MAG TPA: MBOAT family O-acyltransferase [Flavobacteriales bacterium]|nr:MBOAT family O-acyltransferase [Flavobacteriales bacterium]HMR27755.1 MBOAT family O-acyltransferase [Flavobacteriales bacterium]